MSSPVQQHSPFLSDLCTYDTPSECSFSFTMCVCCELWPWRTLKDKPSVLLSNVTCGVKREGSKGWGLLWQRGLVSLKKASIPSPPVHNPVCGLCRTAFIRSAGSFLGEQCRMEPPQPEHLRRCRCDSAAGEPLHRACQN